MENSSPIISIIFPSYNAEKFIQKNLRSIQAATESIKVEIIIVDNNSKDNTLKLINQFDRLNITTIKKQRNLGYAKACNIGVKRANGEFIFITNQDVFFPSDFFKVLLETYNTLESDSPLILSTAVVFPDKRINYFGGVIHYSGISYTPTMYEKLPKEKKTFQTLKASGCSMFMKRRLFIELGGFDPSFFMYKEDVDLSMRALRRDILIYATNETILYHLKEEFRINDFVYYHLERNRFFLILKNVANLKSLLPKLMVVELMLIFHSLLVNKFLIRLKIYRFFIQNYKKLHLIKQNNIYNDNTPKLPKNRLSTVFSPILVKGCNKNRGFILYCFKLLNYALS